jgi:YD repeat-containing protein
VVCSGDGREERHARMGTGALTAPAGGTGRLLVEGDGFVLRSEDDASSRFDSSGRLLGLVDRSGNETVLAYHDGQLVGVTGAAGRVVSFEHDRAGRITALVDCLGSRFEYRYDHRGDLVEMTDPCGAGWSYDYDDDHSLIGITDPEGRMVVRNAYDDGGRVVEQHDGAGNPWIYAHLPGRTTVTDPLEQATSYEHDAEFRTTAVIDPLGAVTRFAWDKSDRLVAVVDPAGGRVTLTYDDRGHLVEAAGPGTAPVAFEWDADDNLTAVVSAEGDRASFAYDEAGRPVRLSSPAGVETRVGWRPDGLPGSVTEGDGGMTCFAYDGAGHLATSTDPLGAVTTVVCDPAGRPVSEVHPSGARTEFGWDAMGRLVSVTEAHGATTTFDYDRSGRLVALTDAVGHTTRYAYEERGLLASVTDPLERETTFTYDACGRLASRTDPGGATVSFSYDPAGRLVGIEAPEVAPVSWTWDRCGRLVSVTDGTGVTTFEYDEAGRPVAERHVPSGIELLHAYDALGRRRRIELHRGGAAVAAWRHDYDADGRIIRVLDPAGQEASLAYDPAGRLREVRHANGVTSIWKYDVAGQPTTLVLRRPTGEVLGQWALAYDADGNRIRARRSWDGGTTDISYGYDALGRLTRVDDGAGVQNVVWDAVGNRLAVNGDTPATFDAADQVRSDAAAAYQHDEAGNLVAQTPRNGGPGLYQRRRGGRRRSVRCVSALCRSRDPDRDCGKKHRDGSLRGQLGGLGFHVRGCRGQLRLRGRSGEQKPARPRQAVHRHRDCTISGTRSGKGPLRKVREGDRRPPPEGNHLGRQDGEARQMKGPIGVGGILIVLGVLASLESVLDKDLAGRPLAMFGLLLVAVGAILVVVGVVDWLL